MDMGEKLKEFRKEYGLSMEKFAAKVGVTLQTVYRWESGKATPSQLAWKALKDLGFNE